MTFVKRPPAVSVLRAVVLPPHGGDTSWADSQLAYESLSPALRALIDPLTAVHDGNGPRVVWRSPRPLSAAAAVNGTGGAACS